jgi:hypothetical protein
MSEYKYEYRQSVVPVTINDNQDEKRMIIEGKAISFNSPTVLFEENGIEYKEVISERALDNTDMKDVLLKKNHDQKGETLARTRNKSLELEIRNDGLYFKAVLPNTQFGRDTYENIKSGLTPDMSFGFLVENEHYDRDTYTRSIDSIKYIREISICDIGAYPDCYVQARDYISAQEEIIKQKEEAEKKAEYEQRKKELILRTYF